MPKSTDPVIVALRMSSPQFPAVRAIRYKVFVEEQKCPPDEEWDNYDAPAVHLLAEVSGVPAGTLRYFDDGGWLHIGRLAVYSEYRGRGIARALLARCLGVAVGGGFRRSFLN